MKDYIQEAHASIRLHEGPGVIEKFLLECYLNPGISTKVLARKTLLPVPLAAAIKKELIKGGALEQASGVRCTCKGKVYIESVKGFGGMDVAVYKKIMDADMELIPELEGLLDLLSEVFRQRPQANVQIDQAKCTLETSMRRAILCLREHMLIGKQILCLGDDDLVSVSLGFLLKLLFPNTALQRETIGVVDIDERFLSYIGEIADRERLPITCCLADLRENIPAELQGRFNCVVTDPPYTLQGMSLFVSRGLSALKKDIGLPIFLSFAHKPPDFTLAMHREFTRMELMVSSVIPRFNEYEGAEMIGNRGQMIILKTTERSKPDIVGAFNDALYTGEVRRTLRTYCCKRCKEEVSVGFQKRFSTIEELKNYGCPGCENDTFDLMGKEYL